MENSILQFVVNVGKLKRKSRKGWTVLHKIKDSESTADHSFRLAVLAWVLGRKRQDLNLEKIVKMALLHDVCEVYAPDETPYDALLPADENQEKIAEIIKTRSRTQYTSEQRQERLDKKFASEFAGLEKLAEKLPQDLKTELKSLWLDFTKGLSPEGKFVKQLDKMENLLQAMEYWKEQGQIQRDLWIISAKEWCLDKDLLEFLEEVDKEFI